MELGSNTEKEFQDESVWVPQTPAKSSPERLKSKDVLSVRTVSSAILTDQDLGLNQKDGKAVNENIKVYIRTKHKGKKKRYRPKVVREVNIKPTPTKKKTPNPATPKPRTPKPPKRGTSRKSLGNTSDRNLNNILKASHEASQDVYLDSRQVSDPSPGVSPKENSEAIGLAVFSENCDINYVQEIHQEVLYPPSEECSDKNLVHLKPEVESKSCRRALNFDLPENDRREPAKDGNASCATWQRGGNNFQMLVYQRKKFKLERFDLQNCRKFGPDFPKAFRKRRTERTASFVTFLNPWLAVGRESENINNRLHSAISVKDTRLNIVKKKRTERKRNLFPTLPSVVGTDGGQNCKQPSSAEGKQSHEQLGSSFKISEKTGAEVPVAQSPVADNLKSTHMDSVLPLSTPRGKIINVSERKIYSAFLSPRSGPPQKKLRVLEDVMKKFQRLYIDDIVKRPGPKKKGKPGELVVYGLKKLVPKVVVDQETEREWNLLMQIFRGGADEERSEDREKWWEEERRTFRVRMLTFVAIMHIIQGDRRFSEWKGSVVDSVVGVFLTQNVSDHLSSSAFMSLASRFPIKPTNELACVNSCSNQTIPVQGVEPERDDCSRNNHLLERESVLLKGLPSVATASNSDKNQPKPIDWDELRRTYGGGVERDTSDRYSDSVDWDAVRKAPLEQVADTIKMRGQHFVIGGKIQAFLNRLVEDHGSIDLEWLRNVPPDKAKEYLLSFHGLGLKSVECIRLLCLHHHAFPVDVNVARVAVRLGWVPLQPLPGGIEFHLLDEYPIMDTVQIYLWPRLCTLDQKTLYELHYQMITFGKVFCKKKKPSCGTCPMKGECRHYASKVASSRLSLPGIAKGTKKESTSSAIVSISTVDDSLMVNATTTESSPPSSYQNYDVQPLVEFPPSPVHVSNKNLVRDIEDWYGQTEDEDEDVDEDEYEDVVLNMDEDYIPTIKLGIEETSDVNEDDIPSIKLGTEELKKRFREAMHQSDIVLPEDDVSKALVALTSGASSIPAPKLKNVDRLKTVYHVYELPDTHPILAEVQEREPDDPSPYLLVVWASDADAGLSKPFRSQSCSPGLGTHDAEMPCSSGNMKDQISETVSGTIMIPCRTANRGRFPLNGTYFQVNEVFADDESAQHPIQVPRKWLWNLRRRFLYCGKSASAILSAIPIEEIQHCFWRGFICVRAFNRHTRAPGELPEKFHKSTTVAKFGKETSSKRKHAQKI